MKPHFDRLKQPLGFGVPYFNTVFLNGTLMKSKFILFSPWLLKSPGLIAFSPQLLQ